MTDEATQILQPEILAPEEPTPEDLKKQTENLPDYPTGRYHALRAELTEGLAGCFNRAEEAARKILKQKEREAKLLEAKAEDEKRRVDSLENDLKRMGV